MAVRVGQIVFVMCAMLLAVRAAAAAPAEATLPQPRIPPGYVPELSKDERGLWMEMQEYEADIAKSPLLVRDPAVNEYIAGIACRVAGPYCSDVRVYVVRNAGFNASMAPTGMMEVWTGVLTRVQSDDDLAVILGHETAHYTRAHTLERFRRIRSGMTTGALASLGLGLATGVLLPIGETVAIMNVLAYSRKQEEEADLLGAKMVADASLDPHASYGLWQRLVEEEQHAVDKSDPGVFMRSHPESAQRADVLKNWVVATYGEPTDATAKSDALMPLLAANYMMLMTDQIKSNRYGRTELMLQWHEAMGIDVAEVEFFRAQMYAQRGQEGDADRTRLAYEKSIATGRAPAEAYRNLGYIVLKANDPAQARALFQHYLDLSPDATDRAMIEFYTKGS